MTPVRWCLALSIAALTTPAAMAAQESLFGVRSPGTPGRAESPRARATGGAFAPFDALSPLTDAVLADLRRLTIAGELAGTYRRVDLAGLERDTRSTRFPAVVISGPPFGAASRLIVAASFNTYLDRTYRVGVRDSAVLRGELERFTDLLSSDGAVADIRLAAGWRFSRGFAVGAGLHLLSGSARSTATRQFDDSATYQNTTEIAEVQHTGIGFSAGGLLDVASTLRLAAWYRADNKLNVSVADVATAQYDLPTGFGGGLRWTPSPELRFAGSAAWRSWEDAGGRNTVEWAVGAEAGNARLPARIGIRSATLPFAPAGIEAKEWGVAGGFGLAFSEARARLDLTLERLVRTGGDLRETTWSIVVGMTLQP
jgi:hypothetical protein